MHRAGVALLAPILALAAYTVWHRLVDRMTFFPERGVDATPADLGIDAEQLFLLTQDGVRIHAFFLPAVGAAGSVGSPGAAGAAGAARASGGAGAARAILFLHGNAGNASQRLPNADALARLGAHVLLLDYRGYGLSEGRPTQDGVFADARAGLAHLVTARGIPETRVVLFGRSLGGAVAVDLARDRDLAGVILESTFTSAADVAGAMLGAPAAWLARGYLDSAAKIGAVRAPLLFFHGDRDEIVPFALGRRLFDLAPEPKRFETLAGAGHNDTVIVGGRPYFETIRRFLDEVAPAG